MGGGHPQRCYTQPAPAHVMKVYMPPFNFGRKLKFFGHMCRGGNLLLFLNTCSRENAIGNTVRQQLGYANQPCPNDKMLEKEEQQG